METGSLGPNRRKTLLTLVVTFLKHLSLILLKMFVLRSSRSHSKLGHGSKTRSLGQIKGRPCLHSRGHNFESIIMNLAQNVCLVDFLVKVETGSLGVKN